MHLFKFKEQIIIPVICVLTILFFNLGFLPAPVMAKKLEHNFQAESVLLLEPYSGKVLFSKNPSEKVFPASVTKLMTVLLALEELEKGSISLSERVEISSYASSMGGSQIFLSQGDKVKVEDLLIGIIVGSANDASVALAERIAGSEEKYVNLMNKRADELNMVGTNFVNVTGLHNDNHYTTLQDMAKLCKTLINFPRYHEWATIWMDEHFLKGEIKSGEVYLSNTNRLIFDYPGCDGFKTGFTDEAKHCLAATAIYNETRFISLVFAAPTKQDLYEETTLLLNYGLNNYKSIILIEDHALVDQLEMEKATERTLPVITKDAFHLLLPKEAEPEITTTIDYKEPFLFPIEEGDILGKLNFIDDNEKVRGSINLLAAKSVDQANYLQLFNRYFRSWLKFGI